MRKGILALLAATLIFSLCSCGEEPGSGPSYYAAPSAAPPSASSNATDITGAFETEEATPAPTVSAEDEQAARVFRSFLSNNYDKLMEASFKSIAGIGFIDLDLDGTRELILFDAGASASMGVQVFDIIDGDVQCVSANIQGIGEAFGGDYLSETVINANFMEDFRLIENKSTGVRFFLVESKNGSIESSYVEGIRFGSDDGALTLIPMSYRYEEYDTETGEITRVRFKIGSTDTDELGYTSALEQFYRENKDLALECRGVFIWESNEYTENYKNFMEIVDKALALYENNRVS